MDQYFSSIPLTLCLTTERYTNPRLTNPQENFRLPYQILSDTNITDFIGSYDRHIQNPDIHLSWSFL